MRRRFALMVALLLVGIPSGAGAGALHDVSIAELQLDGLQGTNVGALEVLAAEVDAHTSLRVDPEVARIRLDDDRIFQHPFLVLAGSTGFSPLTGEQRNRLQAWLTGGGVLLADDRSGVEDSAFKQSLEREMAVLFPQREFVPLDPEHAVHRSFFLAQSGAGRKILRPYMLGIQVGDTTPVLLSLNDLTGALEAGRLTWNDAATWRGDAVAVAINVVVYAVTANYKRDAVHVRTLMERLRREGGRWP